MRAISLITVMLWLGAATAASPQDRDKNDRTASADRRSLAEWIRPGDEIRFTVNDATEPSTRRREPLTGWLAGISADSLAVRLRGRKFRTVPLATVEDLEVKRQGGATTGGVVGGLVGLGVGIAVVVTSVEDCDEQLLSDLCESTNALAYVSPLLFGVGGLLVGRWIGGQIARAYWERVPFHELSLRPSAAGDLAVSIGFKLALGR